MEITEYGWKLHEHHRSLDRTWYTYSVYVITSDSYKRERVSDHVTLHKQAKQNAKRALLKLRRQTERYIWESRPKTLGEIEAERLLG